MDNNKNFTLSLSLLINFILIIAITFLYYLHFSESAEREKRDKALELALADDTISTGNIVLAELPSSTGKVVYVNYDSLMENYLFFQKIKKDIDGKVKKIETELMKRQQKLEEDYAFYQKNQTMMTVQHREAKEKELMLANQELLELRDKREDQLMRQEKEMNEQLMDNLYGYFQKLAKENDFAYILTYKRGMPGVLYGENTLDITKQLVDGLNKDYKEKNKK